MQYIWINKKNNKKLIVFLNGWAMNETAISHLNVDDFDILMVNDYSDINFDFKQFEFDTYEKKYLITWSMGVYAANLFYETFKNFDKKIAINGTAKIIDNNFGIPVKIYNVTVKFLNESSLDKFIKNMFDNGKLNPQIKITRNLDDLKEELISIQNFEIKQELAFDKAIISDNDKVVPTKNQINFWKNRNVFFEIISSTHCPFEFYKNWAELC